MSNIEMRDVITSDGIRLAGKLRRPTSDPRGGVVLAHPHPAFGASMDVWLLPRIGERLAADGWMVLRVNFRGVGTSEGRQTGGAQEHLDLEAAVSLLRDEIGAELPMAAVGWSFGAMIALRLGDRIGRWVGIAPPTRRVEEVPLAGPLVPDQLPPHRTVIVGDHDQFFPVSTVDVLRPHAVVTIPDADHFLFDRDPEVAEAVASALRPLLSRQQVRTTPRLGGRYVVRITPADVGSRVSVRYELDAGEGEPPLTDVVGDLVSWEEGVLVVRKRDGTVIEVPEASMLAGRTLPPPVERPPERS